MALIEKTISNHPATGLERKVIIVGDKVNDDIKEYQLYYRIEHYLNGHPIPVAVPNKDWTVDNSYRAIVRDAEFNPIPNPDYIPEYEIIGYTEQPEDWDVEEQGEFEPEPIYGVNIINEEEVNILMPAYDYFKSITYASETPVSIPVLLEYYIADNDSKGFFNFY